MRDKPVILTFQVNDRSPRFAYVVNCCTGMLLSNYPPETCRMTQSLVHLSESEFSKAQVTA
jgi:hypothetical protein